MNLPAKLPKRQSIREQYNRRPNKREKAYHLWLCENYLCICGCGCLSEVVHHVLGEHDAKRWRRDHLMVVPMKATCHMKLHGKGSEEAFDPDTDYPGEALNCQQEAIARGIL